MKFVNKSKAILYLCAALFIFIFHNALMPYIGYVVGGVVAVYAIEELLYIVIEKTAKEKREYLFDIIAQFLISAVLFCSSEDIERVCVIWGVWAILRESKEMTEAIGSLKISRFGWLNITESVVIIVLSFIMIIEPSVQHARLHAILLGVELILVIFFSDVETLMTKKAAVKKGEDPVEEEKMPTI